MSTTTAIIGKGTTIGYAADGTTAGSFTLLAEIKDVGAPKVTIAEAEATHYTSPNGAEEFIPGWLNGGEVDIKGNYINSDRTVIEGMLQVMKWWQIILPKQGSEVTAGGNWMCRGFIKALGADIPLKEAIQTHFSVKFTGKPVWTAGT
jgi:hypothetical protein